jgi:meso-butanediol dehydrogenase / (S,S)-butanediol dehydrogenase / diacetyl reductase
MEALAGKAALVTGAGTGIGRAIARALAGAGARVMVSDVDAAAAQRVAGEIGAAARGVQLDVTDAAATARAIEATLAAFGRLDVVAANAGISTMNRVVDLTEDEWDRNMDVNAKGIFLTNQAAVRHWTRSRRDRA